MPMAPDDTMATSQELRQLIRILDERQTGLREDDVAWAFEGENTTAAATAWVREYLQPSTLLTRDEMAFYERHGIANAHQQSLPGRPISDAEFEAAIDSLQASTAAIERQCESLERQKAALQKLKTHNPATALVDATKERHQATINRDKAQLDFEIDDMSQSTRSSMRSAIKQVEGTTASASQNVTRLLEKDDRLLDGLQKLLPKLTNIAPEKDDAAEVEQLCSTLADVSIREIHARLDNVYRDSFLDYSRRQTTPKDLSDQQRKQRENLRIELKELSGEIDGLVGIVVDHQHRKCLKNGLLVASADAEIQRMQWAEYTISALLYLTSRVDSINDHIQHVQAQGAALRALSETLDDTLATDQAGPGAHATASPAMERQSAKGLKPLRLVQANFSEAQDPTIPLLRQFEIRVSDSTSVAKLADSLDDAIHERQNRSIGLTESTEENITDTVARSLGRIESDMSCILNSVYGYSTYGTAQVVDASLQSQMNDLESATERLGDQMREIDIDSTVTLMRARQNTAIRKLTT